MLEILKSFNYIPPVISITDNDSNNIFGITGPNKAFEVVLKDNIYILYIKGQQWMLYENNCAQVAQLFSHYYIAEGDVISTGLGFAARELWLLNNPKVKSLTILEKNENIIKYQKKVNPSLFDKAKIICCDANTYKGECDTLLLDHYELESMNDIIADVKIMCNNIKCNKMWFWHLETLILANLHNTYEDGLCDRFRSGDFKIDISALRDIKIVYELIKSKYGLDKLPDLTYQELQFIVSMFTSFFQIM